MVDSVESYLSLVVTLQNLVAFMLYHVGVVRCWVAKICGCYKYVVPRDPAVRNLGGTCSRQLNGASAYIYE